jgi:GT2 family glycosyltransferase/glycosyltransferase involved in cell wall biosynthesis
MTADERVMDRVGRPADPPSAGRFPIDYPPCDHERKIWPHFGGDVLFDPRRRSAPAVKVILLGFSNRSGSSFLGSALASNNRIFNRGESLNAPLVIERSAAAGFASFQAYVESMCLAADEKGKALCVKVGWSQLFLLDKWGYLDGLFSDVHYLHIRRRDLLAQAISFRIAFETKQWSSRRDSMRDDVEFSYEALSRHIQSFARSNRYFEEYFALTGRSYTPVVYEDLIRDPAAWIEAYGAQIGLKLGYNPDRVLREQQSDPRKAEFKRRFLEIARSRAATVGVAAAQRPEDDGPVLAERPPRRVAAKEATVAGGPCRHGDMRWLEADQEVGRALALYGEWAEAELAFLRRLVGEGDTVVEIGANVGAHTLPLARAVGPAGKVLAIEPDPMQAELLAGNAAANGLSTITIEPQIPRADLPEARLVRIDGRRWPDGALAGAIRRARHGAVVAIEVYSLAVGLPVFELLHRAGLRLWFRHFPLFRWDNFRNRPGNIYGFTERAVFLAADRAAPPAEALADAIELEGADHFATLHVRMPRAGDRTAHDRDLTELSARIAEAAAEKRRALAEEQHMRWYATRLDAQNRFARAALVAELSAPTGVAGLVRQVTQRSELRSHLKVLRKSGLFDAEWYLKTYPDVARAGVDPLLHYLVQGASEGRNPNEFFDGNWYLDRYADVSTSGVNPLVHYAAHGGREGRPSGPAFDAAFYLETYPDVARSGENPLAHFLRVGRGEGRLPTRQAPRMKDTGDRAALRAAVPKAPAPEVWDALARELSGRPRLAPLVDVIVPVYRGYDDTLACIHSVLTAPTATPFELVVIDDASPEPELSAELARLAGLGLFTLLVNAPNRGFVGTANRGMALHPDRDVLLLNSDTVVYNDWLDRLRAHVGVAGTGTVTPLSNNATICSYPRENEDNNAALELSYADLDRITGRVNAGSAVEVPTGVGFCMYVRRALLDDVGLFDEELFGRGYGEENDLCQRAAARGWRNLLATDVFVRHTGEVSFAATASASKQSGLEALTGRHPEYLKQVFAYIADKPAAAMRRRLDAARLGATMPENGAVAFVTHAWVGGITRHLNDMAAMLASSGRGVVVLAPRSGRRGGIDINSLDGLDLPNLSGLELAEHLDEIAELLEIAGVRHIHVHSLVEWPSSALSLLPRVAERLGVGYDFTFHDYLPVCPRINMIDDSGVFCGVGCGSHCRQCLETVPVAVDATNIDEWREAYRQFLVGARRLYAPSADTAKRIMDFLPERKVEVMTHPEPRPAEAVAAVRWRSGARLRVAVIGAIGPHKGSKVLLAMAKDAKARRLPIDFVVVGHTDIDAELGELMTITGRYREDEVDRLLAEQRCHVAFIPSVWPETYCYTLSIALGAGFPVAVFDLGAQRDRLVAADPEGAIVLPAEAMSDAGLANDLLLASAPKAASRSPRPGRIAEKTYSFASYYGI